MFRTLKEFFAGQQPLAVSLDKDRSGTPTDHDLHIAAAVLLVEMARSDEDIAPQEGRAVVDAIAAHFNIPEKEIPELVQIAIAARKEQGRIDEFVKCINERFEAAQRQRVLAMLWKVVLADGSVAKHEERLATQMKFRFQLTDEQAAEARRMAEDGTV